MHQQQFKQECLSQLLKLFTEVKNHHFNEANKSQVRGFMAAGEFIGLLSHQESQDLIEQAHQQVFAESIVRRQNRNQIREYSLIADDDDYFNIPDIWR